MFDDDYLASPLVLSIRKADMTHRQQVFNTCNLPSTI